MILNACTVSPPTPSPPSSPSALFTRLGTSRKECFAGNLSQDIYIPKFPRIVLGSASLVNEVSEQIQLLQRICKVSCRSFDLMALYFLRKNRHLGEITKIFDALNESHPESLIFCGFGGCQTQNDLIGKGQFKPYAIFADLRTLNPTFYEFDELHDITLTLFCTARTAPYLEPSLRYL